jgi:hypothetical protein
MRTEADELQGVVTDLAIDENEVRPNMAIAVVTPFPSQRVVAMTLREWLIGRQEI